MAYDPKKKVKAMMRKAKRNAKKTQHSIHAAAKSPLLKKVYLQGQANKMSKNKTAPEIAFEKILIELNVEYEDQKIVGGKIYDYYIPSINLLCEVDGDYYHAHPDKYDTLNEMQKSSVKRDKRKNVIAKGLGYNLVRFWESDIHDTPETIKSKLLELLA